MQNTSQMLFRNIHLFAKDRVLFLGVSDTQVFKQWCGTYEVVTNDWGTYQEISSSQKMAIFTHDFSCHDVADSCDIVIIILPKSRRLLDFWLDQLRHIFHSGKKIFLIGEKNAGIQGASKQLNYYCDEVNKIDVARHCQLWRGILKTNQSFKISDWSTYFNCDVQGRKLNLCSIPGVFNEGKIDKGTQLLLENLGDVQGKRVLDFACGSGIVGLAVKTIQPNIEVDFLDVSAEAIYATKISCGLNSIKADIFASDGLSEIDRVYDKVYSNPPFHNGVRTDYNVAHKFFEKISKHLIEGGELRIVANSFLKYHPMIERFVGPCRIVKKTKRFNIYSAINIKNQRS